MRDFVFFLFVLMFAHSCASQQGRPGSSPQDLDEELVFEEDNEPLGSEGFQLSSPLKHPRLADEASTRTLIFTHAQPSQNAIAKCRDTVNHLSSQAKNQGEMLSAIKKVAKAANNEIAVYHWCFYQSVAGLDLRMNERNDSIQAQADIFVKNMRLLWILSKALERLTQSERYFKYLQERYLQMSQNYFGRKLEETDNLLKAHPFSKKTKSTFHRGKPAGLYQE